MIADVATLAVLDRTDDEIAAEARRLGIALKVNELRRIAERLERNPTIVEAHAFDAQWSEHCSYKSTRAFLSRLPTEGPTVVLGPGEDAGIVHLGEWQGERYGIVIAHESHNHPSQVVPYEGAATGVGGIVRDVLCMGAQVIALSDQLRFGPLDDPHCRYVAQSVVDGVGGYGNPIGVPNIAGDVYFHEGFRDNCLVNVVALGLVNERDVIHSRAPEDAAGWDIVLIGKATDRSGFGGAAFSSLVLNESDAEANKGAVQVPDPFLKNVIMHATYRAFEVIKAEHLTVGFKDLGAGGIMGCTAELVASGGFGATIDLDRCPTSQPNLPPAVIAVGETQERLAWVVPPEFTPRLLAIYNEEYGLPEIARGACAAVIGTVSTEQDYVLRRHGEEVMRVPIDFLTEGIRYERAYDPVPSASPFDRETSTKAFGPSAEEGAATAQLLETAQPFLGLAEPFFKEDSYEEGLRRLWGEVLAHHDVCSRQPIYERFDAVVRGTTSIPAGVADAGLIVPIPGAPFGVALGVGGNPRYGAINATRAGELAVCEAIRNVVAIGARPVGLSDCLNFGNPESPRQFGEFVGAIDGLARAASALGMPFVSGNVSLYNESKGGDSIPASPIVACVGAMQDISRAVTPAFKRAASAVYRLGVPTNAFGGSVYAEIAGTGARLPLPLIDYAAMQKEVNALLTACERGLVLGAHDVSDGGFLTAVAEMCFAAQRASALGVELSYTPFPEGFDETGCFVVEVSDAAAFEAICGECGVEVVPLPSIQSRTAVTVFGLPEADGRGYAMRVGTTIAEPQIVMPSLTVSVKELHEAWSAPLRDFFKGAA